MPGSQPQSGRFAALRHRKFRVLWSGLMVSNVGTWMQNVAQGWLVLQLTNSPLWLGLLGLSFALPMTIGPLFGGAIADRVHRVRLLYLTQSGMMLLAVLLTVVTALRVVNVWYILASSFVSSSLLAFDNPARHSLVPELVPPRDLLNALSINSATFTGAALVGPAIAGTLLGRFDAAVLFGLNALSYVAVLLALGSLRGIVGHGGAAPTSIRRSVLSGFAYAWRNRLVFTLLSLSAVASIFGRSYQNLLPVFSRDIWRGGPEGYGFLLSAGGGGALVGAFGLASFREIRNQGALLLGTGLAFVASLIAFALGPSLPFGIAMLFLAGVTSTVFATIVASFLQLAAPNQLRGRVMSLYAITLIGLPSLGALGTSAVAEWLGGVRGAPRAVLMGALLLGVILLASARSLVRAETAVGERREP